VRSHVHSAPALTSVTALRSAGRRVTRQRSLIWRTLVLADGGHLSAREVADALPDLHPATVYRTLDVLVAEGLARRSEIGRRTVYEVAAEHRHHHVVCTSCGRVTHLHDDVLEGALARIASASGYALADDELTFRGTCPACAAPSTTA
jgi:Fe2+ or Zn2+ uptake regulation protein